MSDACYLSAGSNELIKAEEFLEKIERSDKYKIIITGKKVHFFGFCQGCRNKVILGTFKREDGNKVVQYFRHHKPLYDSVGLQKLEACGWYEPNKGKASIEEFVDTNVTDLVKRALRAHAYGIWRFINTVIFNKIGKISNTFYVETITEILSRRRITAGEGYAIETLPFYILSQINGGAGTVYKERMMVSKGERKTIWFYEKAFSPAKWTYIHLSLLPRERRRHVFGIIAIDDSGNGAPEVVREITIPLYDPDYSARIAEYEEEGDRNLAITEEKMRAMSARDRVIAINRQETIIFIRASAARAFEMANKGP